MNSLSRRVAFALLALLLLAAATACGAAEEDESYDDSYAAPAPTPMAITGSDASFTTDETRQVDAMAGEDDMASVDAGEGASNTDLAAGYPPVSAQNRLIVRIVDMTLEVDDVSKRMDDVAAIAVRRSGWVVAESRYSKHAGAISIRVPSAQLDAAVRDISALGLDVLSLSSTSQDVTEEYFDVQARIANLQATLESLRALLEREGELEDILKVQQELTRVSGEIEVLEGRKRYLEQTSATSLINVSLSLVAAEMAVDAGPDLQGVEWRNLVFRATFTPPEDIEDFEYWWDFGDGTNSGVRTGTAQTETPGERITETVRHAYESADESPYFVTLTLRGTGDAGVVEAEDAIKVVVSRVPTIVVSTDQSATIRAGDEVTLTGTFTRPADVVNLAYEWNFGDGLAPSTGSIEDGQTEVTVTHEYSIDRSEPYAAQFIIRGETSFGAPVESSSVVQVHVEESSNWVIGFLDIPETARAATRVLSVIGQALVVVLIWVVLLSPVWGAIVALIWFLRSRTSIGTPSRSGSRRQTAQEDAEPEEEDAEPESEAPPTDDENENDESPR